ncbi:transcription factor IIIB subunit Brf1 [Kipferlia bialata]|uniref:Transcription factor IIIB subunit Brf1 n=1 Tax=Kipferlia bialata TaxID=797122 RepID=A0A9K3D164_9EUKA|nr:transcription factor IIIB subunit Brf1 [Kipferlia bialata]|eukprot:g8202.t1
MSAGTKCACGGDITGDYARGLTYCSKCGQVMDSTAIVSEVTFAEAANGNASVVGQFVAHDGTGIRFGGRGGGFSQSSSAATISRFKARLMRIASHLHVKESSVDAAKRYYVMAKNQGFTRGRNSDVLAAVLLYIVCRQSKSPHMLLDFADKIGEPVEKLGKCFLAFTHEFNIQLQVVDPSLYMRRFVQAFSSQIDDEKKVLSVSLRILQRATRDYLHLGRKPSGLCAAALFVACRVCGSPIPSDEIAAKLHVSKATVEKRLAEIATSAVSTLPAEVLFNPDTSEI